MLQGQCGEMGIGGQVASSSQGKQEVAEYPSVARAGMDYRYGRLFEPGIHQIEGGFDGKWDWEQTEPGRQPKEGEKHNPR